MKQRLNNQIKKFSRVFIDKEILRTQSQWESFLEMCRKLFPFFTRKGAVSLLKARWDLGLVTFMLMSAFQNFHVLIYSWMIRIIQARRHCKTDNILLTGNLCFTFLSNKTFFFPLKLLSATQKKSFHCKWIQLDQFIKFLLHFHVFEHKC